MHGSCDEDDCDIVDRELFVPRRHAPPLLEPVDAPFYDISTAIAFFVKSNDSSTVGARRNDRLDAALAQSAS